MSNHNPYEAPVAKVMRPAPQVFGDEMALARYAQMLLRVVGVWLTIEGAAGILGSLVYAGIQCITFDKTEYARPMDLYSIAWFTTSVATCVGGLYLVIGGRLVLEKVFLPSSGLANDESQEKVATSNDAESSFTVGPD